MSRLVDGMIIVRGHVGVVDDVGDGEPVDDLRIRGLCDFGVEDPQNGSGEQAAMVTF